MILSIFKHSVVLGFLLFSHHLVSSQTVQLGTLSTFEAYTGTGAVSNAGTFTGDVGSDVGAITGTYNGTIYNADSMTDQARIDLLRLYIHLSDIFVTHPSTHAPAFGGGETITPGVYYIGSAGSVDGTVTLDGGGDPDAVFIIKLVGALTVGGGSTIILSNGTRACNVFWIAEGAISVKAGSVVKGTLIAHPGAITLGANSTIEGRMLTTEGAISIADECVSIEPAGPITIPLDCISGCNPAAAVDVFGSVENFGLFTSFGAVANAASSGFIGDVGTHGGAISGFATSTMVGSFYNADRVTEQAKADLDIAYTRIMAIPNTVVTHAPAFGSGETLNAGVYYIGSAGSLAGTVILDAQGNPDAVFVFKFAGAFSIAAQSLVIFANGTQRCNVIWLGGAGVTTGAVSVGGTSYMKGTLFSHGGACSVAAGANIEGRMFSTGGAIGFSTGVLYNDPLCFSAVSTSTLPIELLRFSATAKDTRVQLDWVTTSEINNDYFNVERSADGIHFNSILEMNGAGNSTKTLSYSIVDNTPLEGWSYYRLKQTDYDGKTSYSETVAEEFNTRNDFKLEIYPNPFSEETVFHATKDLKDITIVVSNSHGRIVKEIKNISGRTCTLNCENLPSGIYFVNLVENGIIVANDKLLITN